ncbi:Para-nitrobenzyl esterase [Streptomyces sp. RB5]|uniref:Para-nitrobenzyl esterase n=1 Tax=Streptomyces smaragdinus TaxID=2585196 RepID=A0A7K0C9L7_9ACTN|nr:Para-nitrobenzyl esterase [Streptomyces smaragdinus]
MRRAFVALAALLTVAASSAPGEQRPVVRTDSGAVRGTVAGGHQVFSGIPYAAPPTGAHRWAAPRPVRPWPGVRDATRPGPLCPQVPAAYGDSASLDEDCLVLNVTTPARSGRAPVFVWIHGDGTIGGGSFFDARRLADRGLVVVTLNYRLGVFGGFAHPGLPGSGTFGLQDQQAALRWVARNAAAFGGDPGNVTLAGSSFGAGSVTAHLTSPSARGLFHRAVLSSGEGMMDMPAGAMGPQVPAYRWYTWRTLPEMRATGRDVAAGLGCGGLGPPAALRCLRALPVKRILDVPQVMNMFQAFAFGEGILPELPEKALREGRFHRVPVLSGATRDEHRLFAGLLYDAAGKRMTERDYTALVTTAFGTAHAPAVLAEYPAAGFPTPALAWATVITDRMWARGMYAQHTALGRHVPTFAYEFADPHAPMYLPLPVEGFDFGAYHASDTPYVFEEKEVRFTPPQARLADTITDYWAAFATTGTPSRRGLPSWPAFAPSASPPHTQSLAPDAIASVDYAAEHRLGFWGRHVQSSEASLRLVPERPMSSSRNEPSGVPLFQKPSRLMSISTSS